MIRLTMTLALLTPVVSAATPCVGPDWTARFTATPTFLEVGLPVHFEGIVLPTHSNCGVVSNAGMISLLDFGDGGSTDRLSVDHYYQVGEWVAVFTVTAFANWSEGIFNPYQHSFRQEFNIVSHAPEPPLWALLAGGLGLIGWVKRK